MASTHCKTPLCSNFLRTTPVSGYHKDFVHFPIGWPERARKQKWHFLNLCIRIPSGFLGRILNHISLFLPFFVWNLRSTIVCGLLFVPPNLSLPLCLSLPAIPFPCVVRLLIPDSFIPWKPFQTLVQRLRIGTHSSRFFMGIIISNCYNYSSCAFVVAFIYYSCYSTCGSKAFLFFLFFQSDVIVWDVRPTLLVLGNGFQSI